jgi:multidrug resistance efflux pump
MLVQPSQHVLPGTVLAIVDRPQQEDAIRDIQSNLHALRSTQQAHSARLHQAQNNLLLARQFANESDVRWQKVQDKYKDYVTADLSSTLQRDRVDAHAKLTSWENDLVNLPKQIDLIQTEIRRLETDIHDIERTWRHKLITTEKESIVGPRVASTGASLSAGAPLLTLYDLEQSYVLWRLPALRLSDPVPGQMVSISHGVHVTKGRVRRVLNLTIDAQDNSNADSNLVEVDWLDTHHRLPVGAQVVVRLINW